ncbi:hypothetical protein OCK02_22970 [Rhizobium sp. TRM96647]|uniref:hypothetical protein n=1 Tax=unclassified Rhizobium TaxID=2613769 RepID=UPI0021E7806C|nr:MULTISPECIES: hypothetical protein [unclassified Rhizobium]MCV3739040.1 hypothetical protein [Rhizobium sp. TRM96647]MCV3760561.1 hypothetical protein [Rhizobium sp. TRM96650]
MADQQTQNVEIADYLAYRGGPFFELQKRLGLLRRDALNARRRALIYVAIAWLVPLLLALPDSLRLRPFGMTYVTDVGLWGRFVLAIGAVVLAEEQVEERLRVKLQHFKAAPLITPESMPAAARAVNRALRLRNSRIAEAVCLVIAYALSAWALRYELKGDSYFWAASSSEAGRHITLAGWWALLVSLPLFWFLVLRGFWRHFVWAQLLRVIARLELRLVASHPDGKGGLAFLADYPNAYMTFMFGLSCAIAASFGQHISAETLSVKMLTTVMGAWLVLVLGFFAYPLSAFARPLRRLREDTMLAAAALATQRQRQDERKILSRNIAADGTAEPSADTDIPDPAKLFEAARKLKGGLLSRTAVLPLSAMALLPFAVVGLTQISFEDVLSLVKKLLLL